jgi:hypothetical protein
MAHNPHTGSDFDIFLREEGLYEECSADSWCVAIASGQSWNGFRTTQGKVLIIQTDEPDVDFSDSLRLVQVETEWQFSQIPQLTRWVEQEQFLPVIIDFFTANCASESDDQVTNT